MEISISGFGNGAVPTGAACSGTAPVRLDRTQAEKGVPDWTDAGAFVIVKLKDERRRILQHQESISRQFNCFRVPDRL